MFGNHAFQSWAVIIVGAMCFAMLFMMLGMMAELLFEGTFQMTPGVAAFGAAAFFGYVGAAWVLRRDDASPRS